MRVTILTVDWKMLENGMNFVIDAQNTDGDVWTFWTLNKWKAVTCKDNIGKSVDVRTSPAGELLWVTE